MSIDIEAGTYTLPGVPPIACWAEALARSSAAIARAAVLLKTGDSPGRWDDCEEMVEYMLDGVVILSKLSAAISEALVEAEAKRSFMPGWKP